jgi:hypothetical protein
MIMLVYRIEIINIKEYLMKKISLCIMLYIGSTSAVFAEAENPSFWSWVKDKATEISSTATEKASDASSYISKSYYEAVDGSVAWTKETYNDFSTDYPEIATNIESFASSTSEYSNYAYEKTKDGALVAYEVTADGTKTAVDWTSEKISKVPEITACDIANYDFAGGVAVGTLTTAMAAGTTTTTTSATLLAVTPSAFVPVFTSISVVAVPAIAIGVTATALAGATVYATSKGVCYYQSKKDVNVEEVESTK